MGRPSGDDAGHLGATLAARVLLSSIVRMPRVANRWIPLVVVAMGWDAAAQAEEVTPQDPAQDPAQVPSDEQVLEQTEVIDIVAERPDKPFDRDTVVRITGKQLEEQGATDLRSALALIPELMVRDVGRGGFNVDIRGARKGAVSVMIDGVVVTDPYYGTFDVSTIPITDIVQIRVSTTPQSPIDGPGGPGGVIEVHTRDAIGEQLVIARMTSDSLPTFGIAGAGRAMLSEQWAIRLSAGGTMGTRDFELPAGAPIDEGRRAATGAGRLEYRDGDRILVVDGFLDDRSYVSPPSDTMADTILLVDRETSMRATAKLDDKIGTLQLQGQYWVAHLRRQSRFFSDPELTDLAQLENLSAIRSGGHVLATKPFRKDYRWVASANASHEKAIAANLLGQYVQGEVTLIEGAVGGQLERGKLRIDSAVGVALPLGVDATPWPEVKSVGRYKLRSHLEVTATAGYKGRVPSLRERFDAMIGNPALGPEKALHGEVRVIEKREHVSIEAAPFVRRTTGIIRTSQLPEDMGRLVNLDVVNLFGIDVQIKATPHRWVDVGGAYGYILARGPGGQADPIDRLPNNRFDVWTQLAPTKRFAGLVKLKYFGESVDRGAVIGGYATIEANFSAHLLDEYLAVLRLDDALDEQPETRAGYHGPGRVISLVLQGTWQ